MTDARTYRVTDESDFIDEVADLEDGKNTWPDGRPMTEAHTAEYSERR